MALSLGPVFWLSDYGQLGVHLLGLFSDFLFWDIGCLRYCHISVFCSLNNCFLVFGWLGLFLKDYQLLNKVYFLLSVPSYPWIYVFQLDLTVSSSFTIIYFLHIFLKLELFSQLVPSPPFSPENHQLLRVNSVFLSSSELFSSSIPVLSILWPSYCIIRAVSYFLNLLIYVWYSS